MFSYLKSEFYDINLTILCKKSNFVKNKEKMQTTKIRLTPQLDLAIDDVLDGVSKLETSDLELFLQKIGRLVALRKSPSISEKETILLKAINESTPSLLQNQYMILAKKLHEETITEAEHSQLLEIIDQLEAKKVERLQNLIELAHLRNTSLNSLMEDLNLS